MFSPVTTALDRGPFWVVLTALAAGLLLYGRDLSVLWRLFLVAVLGAVVGYAFYNRQESASTWVSVSVVVGVLAWFRFRRVRWVVLLVLVVLFVAGGLTQSIWEYAGGDEEWEGSGGSRLALIERVVEVTMRNPITGLGPASYRAYAAMKPLAYRHIFWVTAAVNSHNNYVDLFAHTGLVGLGLFLWMMAELGALALRLRSVVRPGFLSAFVHAMLATWASSLVLMLFADWLLPHVYNIGFPGFQAAIPVWLFLGGLVAVDRITSREAL